MSHYIAEKILELEVATGEEKRSLQKYCFEAILLLWSHQAYFPSGSRPFENFEPVFRALDHIDPDRPGYSYINEQPEANSDVPKDIDLYVKYIVNLDATTRVLLSYFVELAISSAADQSTKDWINSLGVETRSEVPKVLLSFYRDRREKSDKDIVEEKIEKLSDQIRKIDAFVDVSKDIRLELARKIENLKG
ncbi:hypothetical protein [Bacterioplanoides pacificum]|uniref:Antitoxin SocA-like Panacea domain-containing protein n=1 Tax=Bacterioplanoides pacificum TaxID=1171596 RepID=A0ABV7VQD4_9GAMM